MAELTQKLNKMLDSIKRRDYYRFDLIVPKKMFAKGKDFPIYNPDWEFDCTWESENTAFPVQDVTGIMLVANMNGKIRVGLIIEPYKINRFMVNFRRALEENECDFEVLPPLVPDEVI
jgi:hypothetical protein